MKACAQRLGLQVSTARVIVAALALALSATDAFAQIDAAHSTITATSKQMNVPVEGKFTRFSAQLAFDAAKPAAGSAQVNVDMTSYDLGDDTYNEEVRGKDWFDAKTYPNATFVSSAIAPAGTDMFNVTGKLTIKGKSQTVVVPVTVATQGAAHTFDGSLTIKRSQFDVGLGEWKDTSVVADDVVIRFHLVGAGK
ncbi:YceI family protein [Paraburkholderia rhizosphaerae]|uniref:Polyisoprenoid-binding protein YceI n=1 Tax=Paraburkholderia rhizosphaerae TaxID=480658 RepID=A0A4R8LRW8_9BURK|nr:YceI family protein [Paraburkholderia rhizosphaerae]TDY50373.1 polyisoprenoid-binding protein YceI [Paraburkholderia rhizosphaerae]